MKSYGEKKKKLEREHIKNREKVAKSGGHWKLPPTWQSLWSALFHLFTALFGKFFSIYRLIDGVYDHHGS